MQIAAAVAKDNAAKAASGSMKPNKPADAPSTCHGTQECYGVPDDSFVGPPPPPPVTDQNKVYTHKYGFYLHVFHDPAAVMHQVEVLSEVYPGSPVYIMSDGGNDYSAFCNEPAFNGAETIFRNTLFFST